MRKFPSLDFKRGWKGKKETNRVLCNRKLSDEEWKGIGAEIFAVGFMFYALQRDQSESAVCIICKTN